MVVIVSRRKLKNYEISRNKMFELVDKGIALGPMLNIKGHIIYVADLPKVSTWTGSLVDLDLEKAEFVLTR